RSSVVPNIFWAGSRTFSILRTFPHLRARIDDRQTSTDRTGRFLLQDVAASPQTFVLDGRTASTPGRRYGVFEVGVELEPGDTTVLPYTSWMPRLDTTSIVRIASPTTGDTVITTPHIPGLELRLPAATVIRDIDGAIATEVGITPIP